MPRIRVVIVDDEPLARRGVRARLARAPRFEVVGEAGTAAAGVRELRKHAPDVVFLDIEMPGADGFALLERIPPATRPIVVFVTAHGDRAIRAFDAEAFDYILKPVDDERFARTLERVEARHAERETGRVDRLIVRDRGRVVALDPASIDWIAGDGDYVRVYAGVASYLHHATLKSIADALPGDAFLRVHRSAIVNVRRIRDMEPLSNGDFSIRLTTGARLRLSRTYRDALSRRLGASL